MGRPSKMSLFEGTRNRPLSKDPGGDPALRGPAGRPTRPSSKDGKNGTASPSTDDSGNRVALFAAYDRISTGRLPVVWVATGELSPLREAGSEDGGEEDTGGSGCCSGDASGRCLLPVDYYGVGCDFRLDSDFREASPPARLGPVKRELESPNDDAEEEEEEQAPPPAANKRTRYDGGHAVPPAGGGGVSSLPQGRSRLLDALSVARLQRPTTFNEDAPSLSKFLVDAFEAGQLPKAFSSGVYYKVDTSGVRSSSGRPIEGPPTGSTRRRDCTGREFEDTCKAPINGRQRLHGCLKLRER